jgi:hypothetical protein
MSDAKAKAEARRAKILARDSSRLSVAKGEKVTRDHSSQDQLMNQVMSSQLLVIGWDGRSSIR